MHMTGGRHVIDCPAYDAGCPTCGAPRPELHPTGDLTPFEQGRLQAFREVVAHAPKVAGPWEPPRQAGELKVRRGLDGTLVATSMWAFTSYGSRCPAQGCEDADAILKTNGWLLLDLGPQCPDDYHSQPVGDDDGQHWSVLG